MLNPVRIVCVDDHPLMRMGLRALIEATEGLALVGEAGEAAAARAECARLRPDLLVIDVRLPDGDGIETIAHLRRTAPALGAVVLSTFAGDETVHRALEAGARGFVLKEYAETELIAAIRAVASGRRYLPREAADVMVAHWPRVVLTPRERDVLRAMARGMRNKEIGRALGMTESTARTHVESVRTKFKCRDRQSTIATATARGFLLDLQPPAP